MSMSTSCVHISTRTVSVKIFAMARFELWDEHLDPNPGTEPEPYRYRTKTILTPEPARMLVGNKFYLDNIKALSVEEFPVNRPGLTKVMMIQGKTRLNAYVALNSQLIIGRGTRFNKKDSERRGRGTIVSVSTRRNCEFKNFGVQEIIAIMEKSKRRTRESYLSENEASLPNMRHANVVPNINLNKGFNTICLIVVHVENNETRNRFEN
ncbi:hypothetical protein Tco_1158519 [Tanacetum coccineum]